MLILRVDDRLIHGQVVAGWARPLGIKTLILVSDRVRDDEWTLNAYRLAIPDGIDFFCVGIHDCAVTYAQHKTTNTMIIVASVCEAYRLLEEGITVPEITIGGLGYREGTREIAPYIYLSEEDINAVVRLFQRGVKVIGKQLPNSATIDVVKNLAGVK